MDRPAAPEFLHVQGSPSPSREWTRPTLPGSKSATQRWLLAAALGEGSARLEGALHSDDTLALASALAALGARVRSVGEAFEVGGLGGPPQPAPPVRLWLGGNATALRALAAVAALGRGAVRLEGEPALERRPLGRSLAAALAALGARLTFHGRDGFAPCTVQGAGTPAAGQRLELELDVRESTQGATGLLLGLAAAGCAARLRLRGGARRGYLWMTLEVLARAGRPAAAAADAEDLRVELPGGGTLRAGAVTVPADPSAAAALAAGACLTGGRLRLAGLDRTDPHPDLGALADLEAAGLRWRWEGGDLLVEGGGVGRAGGVFEDLDLRRDAAVGTAVALAACPGRWELRGLGALRTKESDRLQTLATGLSAAGFPAAVVEEALVLEGTEPARLPVPARAPVLDPRGDHRMAMAFSLAALARPGGLRVREPGCVAKSWPRFFDALQEAFPGTRLARGSP